MDEMKLTEPWRDMGKTVKAEPEKLRPSRPVLGDLSVTSITPSSMQLQWSVPEDSFDSFVLQYRDDQGQPQTLPIDGGSHSVTVPGLSPSHRYRFHLYGLRGEKRIDRVSIDVITAAAEPEEQSLPSEEPQHEKSQTEVPASNASPSRAVLGELRVTSITPSSVQLQWSVPEGSFDSFMLQYRDVQGQPQALPMDGRSDSVTVPGLTPSQRYRFHLYGLRGRKKIDHVSTEAVTAAAEPEELPLPSEEPQHKKPQTESHASEAPVVRAELGELKVSSVTPSSVQLQWSVPEGSFDSFLLQYRDAQGQPQALPIDGRSDSVTVPGLFPSQRYRFHLYGLRGRKKIDHVSTEVMTGTEDPEEMPLPSEEQKHEKIQTETPPSAAPVLRAVLGELKVSSVRPNSVQLQWSAPEGSFDSFTLQYRDAQGQPQALPIDGGSRLVTVPGLSPSRRYRFHLYGLQGRKKTDRVSIDIITGAVEEPEELPQTTAEPQHEKPQTEASTAETTPAKAVLEELRVSSITPSSVGLQWTVPKGSFDSFLLQYRDSQGQPQALPIDGRSRSVTVPGLSPSHRYRFHLYGLRGGKRTDRVSTDTVTASEGPLTSEEPQQEKPKTESPKTEAHPTQSVLEELRVSSVTPNSVQLQWSVPEGSFDSFLLQYRDTQGQPQSLPIDGGSRSVTMPGLSPSQRYRFHLYGLRGRKKIDHVSAEVMTGAVEEPEELPQLTEEPQHEKPQTEAPTSEATPAKAVLEDLRVSSVNPSSVGLEWTVPEGSFDSFLLQYRDAQGQPQALPINGRSRSVTVTGLSPSQRYRFHLYGLRGRKKIDHVSTEVMTGAVEEQELPQSTQEPQHEKPQTEDPTAETAPAQAVLEDLRVSSVTPSSVGLQWTVPKGSFDSFLLQYRDAQGQPQALPIDGRSRSVTVPGLSPSHRYRFHLYGLRGGKRIDRVSTDTVTASEESLPSEEPQQEKPKTESPKSEAHPTQAVLGELRVSSVTPNSVQLQWTVPEGSFDSFLLQYRDAQGQPQALPIDGGSRSVTVPGLFPSRRYRFHLYGLRGRKKIDHVSTEVMTASEEPLTSEEPQQEKPKTGSPKTEALPAQAALEELRVSSVTPNSVQLQWSVPEGSFDSFLLQYRDVYGQLQALPIDAGSRSVTVPGLSPSQRYRFHLYGLQGRKKIDHVSTEVMTGAVEEQELPQLTEEPQHEKPQTEAPTSETTPAKAVLEDLRLSSITPSSVGLQWTVPKGSFDSFLLQYRDAQGQPQALPIDGRSRSVTVPGLSPSHRYRFHLYGLRGGKRTDRVSIDTVTASEEPLTSEEPQQEKPKTESPKTEALPAQAALEELRVSSVTPNSVQLQWSVPEGSFDSFLLQYRDTQGQTQALPIDGGSRSVMVTGLFPSQRYRFHLYGLRGRKKIDHISTEVMTGAVEEPEEFPLPTVEPQHEKPQTEAPTAETTPAKAVLEELRVSSITPSSVGLQWTVPKGSFDSFLLQYRDSQGQPQALPIDGRSRSVTVPGLSPSHRYRFHLYGLRGGKRTDRVSTDTVTASEEPLTSEEPQQEKPKTESPKSEALPARAVLGELRASSVTPNTVQLQWTVPKGPFDSFLLQYQDAQGQPQALPIDGGSRSVTVLWLSPSRRYRFHLYGLRGRKKINHVSTEVMTGMGEGVQEEVWVDDPQGQPQTLVVNSKSCLVTVLGLSPSHLYCFHVYGLHGGKMIDHASTDVLRADPEDLSPPSIDPTNESSTTEAPTTEASTPEHPQTEVPSAQAVLGDLKVSSVTPNSVGLQWSVPEGHFDSFTLQYQNAQGQPQAMPIDGGSRLVTVPGLSPSHRYRFHLYGMHRGKMSDHVSIDIITGEQESQRKDGMKDRLRDREMVDECIDEHMDSHTHHCPLCIAATDKQEEPQTEAPPTEDNQPEHPQTEVPPVRAVLGELKVSSVTPNSVQLQWSVPEGSFDSFLLQYRDAQGQPQALPIDGGSHSVVVPGLSPSHRYRFHLYGLRGRKRTDRVSTDIVTAAAKPKELPLPSEEPKPEAVSSDALPARAVLGELKVSSVTPNSVGLQWSVPESPFDSFTLQYQDAQSQTQALPINGGSRSVTVPGLSPSHRYRFHLYGLQGGKRIDHVSTDVITDAAVPEQLPLPSQEPQPEEHNPEQTQTEQPQTQANQGQVVLGKLRVSSVTPNSVQLQWSVPQGSFDSFTLQYRDAQGQPQALAVDGGSRSVTVPGLSPSRRYRFHLYGLRDRRRIDRVSTDVVTADPEDLSPPSTDPTNESSTTEAPTTEASTPEHPQTEPPSAQAVLGDLKVSSVTPNSVGLQWSVPEGHFDSFTLQYQNAQGQPQAMPIDGGSRLVTVPGLSPSHRYRFHLYGLQSGKKTDHVSTDVITADGEGQRIKAAAVPEELPLPSEEPQDEQHQTKAPTSATPPARAVLKELRVSSVTPNSVQLQWSVPEAPFDSFMLQYRDAQGQPQSLPIDGESRSVTVPGLSPSSQYRFHLYGLRDGKRVYHTSTEAVTAAANFDEQPMPSETLQPEDPQSKDPPAESPSTDKHLARAVLGELRASSVTPNTVQLQWTVPKGPFDSFMLQYRDALGQPQALPIDSGSRSVTVPGLSPSRRYRFHLYGLRGGKRIDRASTDIVTATAKTEELPLPSEEPQPEDPKGKDPPVEATPSAAPLARAELGELKVSSVTPSSVQLQWSVPEGSFDSFLLQYRDAQGQPQALPVDGGSRSVTVPGLSPSQRYRFHLYGLRGGKRIDHVSTEAITGTPGTMWVGSVWPRSAWLHWNPLHAPPDGYELEYGPPAGPQQTLWLPPEATSQQLWGLEPAKHYGVRLWGRGGDPQTAPLEATFDTPPLPHPHPKDCAEEQLNGPGPSRETLIFLRGDPARPLRVFCDMETDGGGWLVFQRRQDGSTDFWRGWESYARGFGNVSGEFWLGNEALHELTTATPTELRVDLRTARDSAFALYRDFAVGGAEERYRLRVGAFSGTAGDALSYHSGSPFSTRDRDFRDPRDRRDPSGRPRPPPCAVAYGGAWWYRNCHYANLNGRYGTPRDHQGIHWFPWKGFNVSIPFTEMKLRPQRG
ncbi:LOW QUALITY PROTEIN: tenascin-X-like [Anomalospiza imberbis]|uniref:LOW QUALITY PROTEIN: tenascin-X-like n=1 Tax=Anomalospiza imberbis TaxID=187417 RepID=UPI00358E493D